MRPSLWRVILAGILGGIALIILPFVFIRLVLFFLLLGLMFRVLWGGRWRRRRHAQNWRQYSWHSPYSTKQPLDQDKDFISI